jgi:methionyl-tRNA formyltransferase
MHCAFYTLVILSTTIGTAGAQSSKPGVASRDLVRECMDADDSLLTRKLNIDADSRADKLALEVAQAAQAQLNEMQSQLNTSDAAAVDAFNKKRAAQNEAGAALNARIDAHTREIDAYNADSKAYNEKCTGVKMKVRDRRKVMRERASDAKSEELAMPKQD